MSQNYSFSKMLLYAVVTDKIQILQDCKDVARLHKFRDNKRNTFLHHAIVHKSYKVFSYLLFVTNFPVEVVNAYGETPLLLAAKINDSFMMKCLLKKGADIRYVSPAGDTVLNYYLSNPKTDFELVCNLLVNGADTWSYHGRNMVFENAVKYGNSALQEAVFLHTFDCLTKYSEISLGVLLKLAFGQFEYFHDVLAAVEEIVPDDSKYFNLLFYIEASYINALYKKDEQVLSKVLSMLRRITTTVFFCTQCSLQGMNFIFNSDLASTLVLCFDNLAIDNLLILLHGHNETYLTQLFFLLFSHGLAVHEDFFHFVYDKYGNGELFKMLLHLDVEVAGRAGRRRNVMASLLCNINLDINTIAKHTTSYKNWKELLAFSVVHQVKKNCLGEKSNCKQAKIGRAREVPLLQELARNVFRRHFVEILQVKTPGQFYTLARRLPVPDVHKDIIMLFRPLYSL